MNEVTLPRCHHYRFMSIANWVWGGEKSDVAPEFCLQGINFLTNGACFSGLLVKGIGVAIIAAACLNKAPVMRNIIISKSAAGFTQFSVYSDILVMSNCAFYGLLNRQPFTAYGENVFPVSPVHRNCSAHVEVQGRSSSQDATKDYGSNMLYSLCYWCY